MRSQPVHEVKGELLARNRSLIPLADSRREYRSFFPRCACHAVRKPCNPFVAFVRRIVERLHHIGSYKPRIPHHFGLLHACSKGILSLEPSFTGAGKKAAYAGRAQSQAEVSASAVQMYRGAERWRKQFGNHTARCSNAG